MRIFFPAPSTVPEMYPVANKHCLTATYVILRMQSHRTPEPRRPSRSSPLMRSRLSPYGFTAGGGGRASFLGQGLYPQQLDRAVPGTEQALCEVNICGMNGWELYKLRVLLKPRGRASNRPGGGTHRGLLESTVPALSVKEG